MAIGTKWLTKQGKKGVKTQVSLGSLLSAGVDASTIGRYVAEQRGAQDDPTKRNYHGSIDTKEELAGILKMQEEAGPNRFEQLRGKEYQWDPDKFLPGIKEQSSAIYDPRQQQLEALSKLQESKYEEQRARTKEEYAQRMQAEEEAINRRGAWFSGGAIRNEQDIRNEQMRLLNQQDLQNQASRGELLAQQGALGYEQSQFEKSALFDSEASAYNRFTNQRAYDYMFETNERDYATQALMGIVDGHKFQQDFGMGVAQLKLAQDRFKEDTRRWNKDFAWNKFMYKNMQQ
jgi:hypothetical protein